MLAKASKHTFLLLLGLICCLALPANADLSVDIQPREVYLGEIIHLRLLVDESTSRQQDLIEISEFRLPTLMDFEVVSKVSSNTSGPNHIKQEVIFGLRPLKSGTLIFPPVTLEYRFQGKDRELQTEDIYIRVKEKEPLTEPVTKNLLDLIWTILGIIAVPLFLGLTWYWQKKRKSHLPPIQNKTTLSEPVFENALELEQSSASRNSGPLMRLYQAWQEGLSELDVLDKIYLWFLVEAQKMDYLPHVGATSQEIISFLQEKEMASGDLQHLVHFLDLCLSLRYSNIDIHHSKIEQVFDLARKIPFEDR